MNVLFFLSLLPRLIIGPNGLSESGLKDSAYSSMYFLTIKPWFYLVIASFILATFFYFWTEIRIKSERSVSIKITLVSLLKIEYDYIWITNFYHKGENE
ncbi:hypothetical protein EfmAA242_20600 [Enterococcus faecium]|nr:hypothetical protein EfmAA242_20600 [Enterococcus faecium]